MKLRPPPKTASRPADNRRLVIEYVPIEAVVANPLNANRHSTGDIDDLAESIKALGMNAPLIVDETGMLLAGEALWRALKKLGWATVPVIRVSHLSREEALLFMLAHNQFAKRSKFDTQALGKLFQELAPLNLNLELSGFKTPEIDMLIQGVDLRVGDEAEAPPLAGPAITRTGELWILRNPASGLEHRLYVGDALEGASYAALMGQERAAAVITDPPFGGKVSGYLSSSGKIKHREFVMGSEGLTPAELENMLEPVCQQLFAAARPGALIYIFMDWRSIEVLLRVGGRVFGELKNLIVWAKTNAGMGSLYRSQHELIALFKIAGGPHRNNVQLGKHGRNRSNVWSFAGMNSTAGRNTSEGDLLALHPTVKPVAMIAEAILDCTALGEIVLDPFLGSGTALIAAERTGRRAFGIELDPLYADCAVRRWQAVTGQTAVRQSDGRSFTDLEKEIDA